MSKKFTGITSAGSAIPVYDKDAHNALEQKLDTSAFSSVSGEFATIDDVVAAVSGKADTSAIPSLDGYATQEWVGEQGYLTEVPESAVSGFATHEEVESATSGKADTSGVVEYANKPSANAIYADGHTLANVGQIVGSGVGINTDNLYLSNTVTARTGGFTANGVTATNNDSYFGINSRTEVFSGGGGGGFGFSSQNSALGTAKLAVNYYTSQTVAIPSPKFEARNISGAGFSIEASAAKGYDHNGNVVWDTTKSPAPEQLVAGYDSPKPNILLSPYMPKSMSAQFSQAPLFSADGNGIYIGNSGQYLKAQMNGTTARNSYFQAEVADGSGHVTGNSTMNGGEVSVYHSSAFGSAGSGTWSLTQSIQKREIACDSATSAITAIAGSAIGGKEYYAGANIDITDEVISGKDWSEDIAGATSGLMQTSGLEYDGDKISGYMGSAFKAGDELPEYVTAAADLVSASSGAWNEVSAMQPSGDYYSASNPSGFMTELPTSATDVIDAVTANSGAWGGNALPMSARDGLDLEMSGDMLWIGASALNETLSGKQDTLTFEYNENSAISAINGSALAGGGGGGDVPEGFMSESGLGFNAVNEISGYNGSAIAQYGAEKQWLVHDDTLVHAANSAQYALGVNVSAVQTLMGLDETVLFSGSESVSSCTLAEPWTAFDRLRLYVQNHAADGGVDVVELRPTSNGMYNYCGNWSWSDSDMLWVTVHGSATDTTLTNTKSWGFKNNFTATAPTVRNNNNNDMQSILKVVGIGKKEIA